MTIVNTIVIPFLACMIYASHAAAEPAPVPAAKAAPVNAKACVGTWVRKGIEAGGNKLPGGEATLVLTDKKTYFSITDDGFCRGTYRIEGNTMTVKITEGLAAGSETSHQVGFSSDGRTMTFTYVNSGVRVCETYQKKS